MKRLVDEYVTKGSQETNLLFSLDSKFANLVLMATSQSITTANNKNWMYSGA